jgi:hypothetical protein
MYPAPAGRMSLCKCGKKFQLAPYNMEEDFPMCEKCTEEINIINQFNEEKGVFNEPEGLNAFVMGINATERLMKRARENSAKVAEEDKPEVIEADEEHAPDCMVYETGECNCK